MPLITSNDGLTCKQRIFIREYLTETYTSGADAARKAGYSEHSARQIAHDLLQRPLIAAIVKAGREFQQRDKLRRFVEARDRRMGVFRQGWHKQYKA